MENIKAGSVIMRSFGGFSNAKSAGFWGSARDPDGGASPIPPSWAGGVPPSRTLPGTALPTVSPPLFSSSRLVIMTLNRYRFNTITHSLDFLNHSSFVRCLCETYESGTIVINKFLTIQTITADHNND